MKKYSALIFDLDGTVVPLSNDGSAVSDNTRAAITAAVSNGVLLACATGREWEIAKPLVSALGLTSPCIIEGGTRIIDPRNDETLWQRRMPCDAAKSVSDIFVKHYKKGLLIHSSNLERVKIGNAPVIRQQLRFMYLLNVPEEFAETIVNEVNTHTLLIVAHMTPSWVDKNLFDIHVTHAEATKEHAIKEWLMRYDVKASEAIGMGDSGNDIPLFNAVGLKIAVRNATRPIRALADYIAPSVNQGALEHVIKRFLLD